MMHVYLSAWTGISFAQIMTCRLFGNGPLPGLMLLYCIRHWEQFQWTLSQNIMIFYQEIIIENVVCIISTMLPRPRLVMQGPRALGPGFVSTRSFKSALVLPRSVVVDGGRRALDGHSTWPRQNPPLGHEDSVALERFHHYCPFVGEPMMTSLNENIFHVSGPLCGKFTGHRWLPRTKASDAELWCCLWYAPWIKDWVNNLKAGDLRRHRGHYDVIVMAVHQWNPITKRRPVMRSFDDCCACRWLETR